MVKAASPASLLPPHGGYRKLKSFQVAQLVYDLTVRVACAAPLLRFCRQCRPFAVESLLSSAGPPAVGAGGDFRDGRGGTERLYRVRSKKRK